MKTYLLLFLSILLLLFTLPNTGSGVKSFSGVEQSMVAKSCAIKRLVKRTCRKGCLKHQTHSEKQNTANVVTDCSQQVYALINPLQQNALYAPASLQSVPLATSKKYLSPDLQAEPDPPQYS